MQPRNSALRRRQRRRLQSARPLLLRALGSSFTAQESNALLDRLQARLKAAPDCGPDDPKLFRQWAVSTVRRVRRTMTRLWVVTPVLVERLTATIPGLLEPDYVRCVCRVEGHLFDYPAGSPFFSWAAETAEREARNTLTLEVWKEHHSAALCGAIAKALYETCADLGAGPYAILEIEANTWLWVSENLDKLNRRGTAKLRTRLVGRAKWELKAWRQTRLRERMAWAPLREELAGVNIDGYLTDLDYGRVGSAHGLSWYDKHDLTKWPGRLFPDAD